MEYWLSITTIPEQDQLLDVARMAEEAGFDGITVADHLLMPTRIDSRYPYTEDGAMWWPSDTPWPDPWVTLAAMGAVTSRLRLASNICIAAMRDPITLAKAVSTASVLSNGRIVLGVAAGWLREEYDLMGVDRVTVAFEKGLLEVAPLAFMRGRTLNHSFVILDEAQNTTPEQMKMFLTRIGFGSRAVVTGDVSQVDLPRGAANGLVDAARVLAGVPGIAFSRFSSADVVRHPLVARIVEAYDAAKGSGESTP